jgi:hypothetical protein
VCVAASRYVLLANIIFNQHFSAHPRAFQARNGNIARGITRRKPDASARSCKGRGTVRPQRQLQGHCRSAHTSDSEVVRPLRPAGAPFTHSLPAVLSCRSLPVAIEGRLVLTCLVASAYVDCCASAGTLRQPILGWPPCPLVIRDPFLLLPGLLVCGIHRRGGLKRSNALARPTSH